VAHALQEQCVGRCWRGNVLVVGGFEQRCYFTRRPAPARNVHQCSRDEPYHVMQEAVRFDREVQASVTLIPFGVRHGAAMVIVFRRCAANRERPEDVSANEGARGLVKGLTRYRLPPCPLPSASEG